MTDHKTTDDLIPCDCCGKEFPLEQFSAHFDDPICSDCEAAELAALAEGGETR